MSIFQASFFYSQPNVTNEFDKFNDILKYFDILDYWKCVVGINDAKTYDIMNDGNDGPLKASHLLSLVDERQGRYSQVL